MLSGGGNSIMVILFYFFLVQFLEPAPSIIWYVGMFFPFPLIPYPTTIGKIMTPPSSTTTPT